jgi:N-acyl-D-aspartate/D-glutamate deacylase
MMDSSATRWGTLIKGGLVFDGTGAGPALLDVAIRDGRIDAIGPDLPAAQAARVIDAAGRWVMPGLLDIHTHFDLEVEIEPGLPEAVRHGTTTVVVRTCPSTCCARSATR